MTRNWFLPTTRRSMKADPSPVRRLVTPQPWLTSCLRPGKTQTQDPAKPGQDSWRMEPGSQVCVVSGWEICHKVLIQIENYYCTKEKNLAQHQTSVVSQLVCWENSKIWGLSPSLSHTLTHTQKKTSYTHMDDFTWRETISLKITFTNEINTYL